MNEPLEVALMRRVLIVTDLPIVSFTASVIAARRWLKPPEDC
jgi:hypothetical protein